MVSYAQALAGIVAANPPIKSVDLDFSETTPENTGLRVVDRFGGVDGIMQTTYADPAGITTTTDGPNLSNPGSVKWRHGDFLNGSDNATDRYRNLVDQMGDRVPGITGGNRAYFVGGWTRISSDDNAVTDLDVVLRFPIWKAGFDFGDGTGRIQAHVDAATNSLRVQSRDSEWNLIIGNTAVGDPPVGLDTWFYWWFFVDTSIPIACGAVDASDVKVSAAGNAAAAAASQYRFVGNGGNRNVHSFASPNSTLFLQQEYDDNPYNVEYARFTFMEWDAGQAPAHNAFADLHAAVDDPNAPAGTGPTGPAVTIAPGTSTSTAFSPFGVPLSVADNLLDVTQIPDDLEFGEMAVAQSALTGPLITRLGLCSDYLKLVEGAGMTGTGNRRPRIYQPAGYDGSFDAGTTRTGRSARLVFEGFRPQGAAQSTSLTGGLPLTLPQYEALRSDVLKRFRIAFSGTHERLFAFRDELIADGNIVFWRFVPSVQQSWDRNFFNTRFEYAVNLESVDPYYYESRFTAGVQRYADMTWDIGATGAPTSGQWDNEGTVGAWPVATVQGPATEISFQFPNVYAGLPRTVTVPVGLNVGEEAVIDFRTATVRIDGGLPIGITLSGEPPQVGLSGGFGLGGGPPQILSTHGGAQMFWFYTHEV